MPLRSKGPRLWLRPARGSRAPVWIIRDDGAFQQSTGCGADDRRGAEARLSAYINGKHVESVAEGNRHAAQIPVADVLALYLRDVAPAHARPKETAARVGRLLGFFGRSALSEVPALCQAYVTKRSTDSAARRELEDLRAAIVHHRRRGLCNEIVEVVLPPERRGRDRWLTRSEAARLLWAAWRYREVQKGKATDRRSLQHIAKFILVGLYTGTRASPICGAALEPTPNSSWIDLKQGIFYRRAANQRETKKRQPPVPLPPSLLAHIRRWKRLGAHHAIEWNGEEVKRVSKGFRHAVRLAGLEDVTPHTLRHTAATWLMQAGTDLWEAAGFTGMTIEMLSERYGHHHPDHLAGAKHAFGRHRQRTAEGLILWPNLWPGSEGRRKKLAG